METTEEMASDDHQNLSCSQQANLTTSESHNLQSLKTMEESLEQRTEASIKDFESTFESIVNAKVDLLHQFAVERKNLKDSYSESIIAIRRKHKLCEESFNVRIDELKEKYNKLEKRKADDLKTYREQISLKEDEIAETKKQADLVKQELENVIEEKEKKISTLESKNKKLTLNETLLNNEIKSKKREFDEERSKYLASQAEDSRKIEDLKKELGAASLEVQKLTKLNIDLNSKYKESQESYFKLEDEVRHLKEQLKQEEKARHEKIKMIQSLTESLDESKNQIEELRKNVSDLEAETESCNNHIKALETQITNQKDTFDKALAELNEEKERAEGEHQEEAIQLNETIKAVRTECEFLKSSLEQKTSELTLSEQEHQRQVSALTQEKEAAQTRFSRLEEQVKELDDSLNEANIKYSSSQDDLRKAQEERRKAEEELIKVKDNLTGTNAELSQFKGKCFILETQLDDLKKKFEAEKMARLEKSSQISTLKGELSSSHAVIKELKSENDQLKRSKKEAEDQQRAQKDEHEEFKTALADCLNERNHYKTEHEKAIMKLIDIEHKLNLVEKKVEEYESENKKLATKKSELESSLGSAGITIRQIRSLNESLNIQISSQKKRIDTLESKNEILTSEKYSTIPQQQHQLLYDSEQRKDAELRRTKRENEELREQIATLEREKRRVERSYVNLEKGLYASSRSSGGGDAVQMGPLASQHYKSQQVQSHLRRTPSPATTVSVATNTTAADQSSFFSASRLLTDPTALLSSSTPASTKISFSKVNRGLEQLEQQHMEIQQKVYTLENLIETASSEGDLLNVTRQSGAEDYATDYKMIKTEMESFKSSSSGGSGHHHQQHHHHLDYNGNVNDQALGRKLRMAQMKAKSLIDASSSFEKEIITEFKTSRSRSQSSFRQNSPRPTENLEQEVV